MDFKDKIRAVTFLVQERGLMGENRQDGGCFALPYGVWKCRWHFHVGTRSVTKEVLAPQGRVASVCALLCLALLLSFLFSIPAFAASRVSTVEAEVTASAPIPPLARERMEESVEAIGSQLLEGKLIGALETTRAEDAALIRAVFDKVLIGYSVTGVEITPAETARIEVRLAPWDQAIEEVEVEESVEGMPESVERLAHADAAGLEEVFRSALLGLPVAAGDWAGGLTKKAVNAYLEEKLPEFRADFEVTPGRVTRVAVTLYPRLPVARTLDLSMRSDTIPNFTLLGKRDLMQKKCAELMGVPVGFIERHKADLEGDLAAFLDAQSDFKNLKITTRVTLTPGEDLKVMSRSDTSRYRLRLTGWLDVGRSTSEIHPTDQSLLFSLHGGVMLSKKDEAFLRLDVWPESPDWDWQLGLGRDFLPGTHGEVRYDMHERRFILEGTQELTDKLLLRYEYRGMDRVSEAALRYRLHDFLALEYVLDREDNWLRVIGFF